LNLKRMKRWFYLTISGLFLSFLFLVFIFLVLFPKYFGVEYLAFRNGVFILSKTVKEESFGLKYQNGQIFYKGNPLGNFTEISFRTLLVPYAVWSCPKGEAEAKLTLKGIEINLNRFGCSNYAEKAEGKLDIERHELFGDLTVEGLKVQNLPIKVQKIILHFSGEKFVGSIRGNGMDLKGEGKIKFDLFEMDKAYISADFKGNGLRIHIYGNIFNPNVELR
jgi:hypothetical protein